MKLLLAISSLGLATACLADTAELSVPADSAAHYQIVSRSADGPMHTLVVKRVSSEGVWFAKREFDCSTLTTRYIGGGQTPEEMNESRAEARLAAMPRGSVAFYLGKAACSA